MPSFECGKFGSETQTKGPQKHLGLWNSCMKQLNHNVVIAQLCPCFRIEVIFRCDLESIA
jgi:hypothetical protein